MTPDLSDLKYQVHAARVALDYQMKTKRTERYGLREQQIEQARARLAAAEAAYAEAKPEPVSIRVRSPYFIGPRRTRGVRGDGPTIKCFRCEQVKPKEEFYKRGTVCRECVILRSSEWAEKNPERVAEIKIESVRERRKSDPGYRIMTNCRNRLGKIIKGINSKRGSHFSELIGTTSKWLTAHIESLFLPGMTWENYGWGHGKWVVDHVIPARFFNHLIADEVAKCWIYTNLQPMWFNDNQEKSDKLPCGTRARHAKILLTA